MADQRYKSDVKVYREDAWEDHGEPAIGASIVLDMGEHPSGILSEVEDAVREKWSKDNLADGDEAVIGTVTHTADEVIDIDVRAPMGSSPSKRS